MGYLKTVLSLPWPLVQLTPVSKNTNQAQYDPYIYSVCPWKWSSLTPYETGNSSPKPLKMAKSLNKMEIEWKAYRKGIQVFKKTWVSCAKGKWRLDQG